MTGPANKCADQAIGFAAAQAFPERHGWSRCPLAWVPGAGLQTRGHFRKMRRRTGRAPQVAGLVPKHGAPRPDHTTGKSFIGQRGPGDETGQSLGVAHKRNRSGPRHLHGDHDAVRVDGGLRAALQGPNTMVPVLRGFVIAGVYGVFAAARGARREGVFVDGGGQVAGRSSRMANTKCRAVPAVHPKRKLSRPSSCAA